MVRIGTRLLVQLQNLKYVHSLLGLVFNAVVIAYENNDQVDLKTKRLLFPMCPLHRSDKC